MSVPSISAGTVSQLAEAYRQQVAGNALGSGDSTTTGAQALAAAGRSDSFGSMIGDGLSQVAALDQDSSTKAIAAATGDLNDIQDYTIAAAKAQSATLLTTTLRDKALSAFDEIMRMQL